MFLVDEGSENDARSILLSTRKRNWIRNIRKPERHPSSMKDAEKFVLSQFPKVKTRSLSSAYNCVGFIFAARRTCVDTDQLNLIFSDDGYEHIENKGDLKAGDLILYRNQKDGEIMHIGVIMKVEPNVCRANFEITVLSQWGFDGEYIHKEEETPLLYGNHRDYLTERRIPK